MDDEMIDIDEYYAEDGMDDFGMDAGIELDEDDFEELLEMDEEEEMLEAVLDESFEGDYDYDEIDERRGKRRRRGRRGRRGGLFGRRGKRRGVPTASRRQAYKRPPSRNYVTHAQLKKVADTQDRKIARNGKGIKTVNSRISSVNSRVSSVARVNAAQSRRLKSIKNKMKIDAALDIAEAYDGNEISLYQLYKGALKSDLIDTSKGAFSNAGVAGGVGFVLNNPELLSRFASVGNGQPTTIQSPDNSQPVV
ncbi:MAG: hypothetical protein AAGL10_05695 [Pseudomonadota bacterium]